jgi:hypothetical protein
MLSCHCGVAPVSAERTAPSGPCTTAEASIFRVSAAEHQIRMTLACGVGHQAT